MGSTTTLTYNTTTHSRQHEEFSCHSFCQHCPRQARSRGHSCCSSWSSSPAPTSRSAHGSPARSSRSSHSSPACSSRSSHSSPACSPRGSPSCRSPSGCPPQCLSPRANGRGEGCPPDHRRAGGVRLQVLHPPCCCEGCRPGGDSEW